MVTGYFVLSALIGLLSLVRGYEIVPTVEDGIPDHLSFTTAPFLKIGHGYYYIESNAQKNWFEASESCHRLGAKLISFETIQEWDLINRYLLKNKIYNVYWTSGSDLAHQGKHDWLETGERITLPIWYPGEPNNFNGNEHCDELGDRGSSDNYNVLNDRPCETPRRYICERSYPRTASFIIW
ncbi:C-type lectin 37Da-like [Drosophila subpulchrella]|uniref:C-type lectin 37Da-like n=1 Tax=Drosophila subpulchrella TaxID=1486046 RepID=UPI0018A1700D|nr:C-type lectin 37Da-like [Drosophila subpulchrella]